MGSAKIVIVDDEREIVAVLRMACEARGYVVLASYDGQEGLEIVRRERPDLVLLDVVMPKMNGYQVCRELKADAATQAIPVFMLTAKGQESDRFWGKETGADEYIIKPFEMAELLQKIAARIGSGSG